RGVFELEAVGVDRQDRRLAPGDELRPGPGLAAGRVHQPRIAPRIARGAGQRLGPGLDLADDLDTPMRLVARDLEGDLRALDAAGLTPAGKAFIHPSGEASGTAADDRRQSRHLPVIGMLVDVESGDAARLTRPQIALPAADSHKAQIVELDVAVMALAHMPEQHRLAKAVIRRLRKGAGACNRAAAIVEPVTEEVPMRDVAHRSAPLRSAPLRCAALRLRNGAYHESVSAASQLGGAVES